MEKLNLLMQLIHYIFFKNNNLKCTAISKRRYFDRFSLFYIFFSLLPFLLSLFRLSCKKKRHVYNLYCILCTLNFCYVMYYIVLEICIGGRFLEDCFYCYFQQIISANYSYRISDLSKQRTPETQTF